MPRIQLFQEMAYNPHMYETVYGFSLLDEVHNFFPEFLYDTSLFGTESANWMRHRINTLFPQVFVRQQNLYNMYAASERMSRYVQWHHENANTLAAPLRPPPAPRRAAPQPAQAPQDISGATQQPAGRSRRAVQSPQSLFTSNPQTLLTSFVYDLGDPAGLLNLLNMNPFNDVPVAPSAEQIGAASRIRHQDEVDPDLNCPVCMEHDMSTGGSEWRQLNCRHSFHRSCIDTWLASHVQCPVCRMDVRDMARQNRT